ncbi:uncharacterized protein F4807DRAFT_132127 [Annulohypoxylon truncatum]|uniref:uncharacterized protein n=1 Tax=Annulohypoxylon truncatum TaxID=327061 RepID=UPI002007A908|nr:uncharacterized protein F4807DRAFT_132127 [Annulohypoxylon truncatum]KAI1208740.1 hypothetical protein F4807DRAFT_132127 [Annulohypoxylon truncatum]
MNGDSYTSRDGRHGSSRDFARDDRRDRGDRRERRRSRSPRRSHRDARDEDAYASSRSHRDREREDRYGGAGGGRDRRDREWDRDRGSRRDGRREDAGGRPPRRDRDLFDDRRGGDRRDRDRIERNRDDDLFAQNRRGRSPTPPPKKREPTPDLTDIIPVLERKRRMTQWDIKPPGYENVTAEQAKLSGMFPLPGAPRQQPMDPTKLQAFMNQPGGAVNSAALKPGNSRQSKRLIVYNVPPGSTEEMIMGFFNLQLNGLNVVESTDPCVLCQISKDQSFALLEFRHASEATVALALDGISMEADVANGAANGNGRGLKIQRPKDYIVPAIAEDVPYKAGVVSNVVIDTPNKISIANLPPYLTEEQVTELLTSFGELKALALVKDIGTEESRGIAFCEFVDPATTDIAIQGLNGMAIGDNKLKVRKASIGITQVAGVEMGVNAMSMLAGTTANDSEETRVLQLLNMVTPEELMDNDDYQEICEDVQEECSKFGQIIDLKVPRPTGGSRQSSGVGKIYVKYDTTASAKKALQALAGRKFADRTVVTTYFPEENFEVGAW